MPLPLARPSTGVNSDFQHKTKMAAASGGARMKMLTPSDSLGPAPLGNCLPGRRRDMCPRSCLRRARGYGCTGCEGSWRESRVVVPPIGEQPFSRPALPWEEARDRAREGRRRGGARVGGYTAESPAPRGGAAASSQAPRPVSPAPGRHRLLPSPSEKSQAAHPGAPCVGPPPPSLFCTASRKVGEPAGSVRT